MLDWTSGYSRATAADTSRPPTAFLETERAMNMTVRNLALVAGFLIPGAAIAADTPQATRTTTFTKDIAPIFQEKCESCHPPGSIAPMSLLTYQEAPPRSQSSATPANTQPSTPP